MSAVGVWKIAAADPERIAVVAVDGTSTSYEKIAVHSNQLARGPRSDHSRCAADRPLRRTNQFPQHRGRHLLHRQKLRNPSRVCRSCVHKDLPGRAR
jgi:hypothetical protein